MSILGLKQRIPEHIYKQAEDARLGKPDFYVGPTVTKKIDPSEIPPAVNGDDDLETRMAETRKSAADNRREGSLISLLVQRLQRGLLKRPRPTS